VTAVVEAAGLGKRYRRRWALADCDLAIPAGRVVGLVGPNGAGKTTLLQLAAGLLAPSAGTITVLGKPPGTPAQLRAVGFVAQDTPAYAGLSVSGHLRMGGWLNPGWDDELAERRILAAALLLAGLCFVSIRPGRPAGKSPAPVRSARGCPPRTAAAQPGQAAGSGSIRAVRSGRGTS
jgi:ABC-type Mn2+/Zn2+ transport system ATPase subunit